jgi:hypothetical protein
MEYNISIAGFSDILGVISVTLSIVVVAICLQRLKGPRDGEPQL